MLIYTWGQYVYLIIYIYIYINIGIYNIDMYVIYSSDSKDSIIRKKNIHFQKKFD